MIKGITITWSILFSILVLYLVFDTTVLPSNQIEAGYASIPGDTNVSLADRSAIKNVVDAYAFYWDSYQLDKFLDLSSDDAVDIIFGTNGEEVITQVKSPLAIKDAKDRMIFFRENGMQRRHMMSSTLFISQTDDHAKISQYAMLVSTNKKTKVDAIDELNSRAVSYNTRIISPIVYTFELKKTGDLWRISRRSLRLDKPLDFALSGKANSSK